MKWASEMTEAEIRAELRILDAYLDAFEGAPDEDKAHGGSPGEWMYERHQELTDALKNLQLAK